MSEGRGRRRGRFGHRAKVHSVQSRAARKRRAAGTRYAQRPTRNRRATCHRSRTRAASGNCARFARIGAPHPSVRRVAGFRGLSDDAFTTHSRCYTIINTNSPRILDIPMAQGLIGFARHGQVSIVTPFTLMGAMAPITVAGAITLTHLIRPGSPMCQGTFTSNVGMKSGAFPSLPRSGATCAPYWIALALGGRVCVHPQ